MLNCDQYKKNIESNYVTEKNKFYFITLFTIPNSNVFIVIFNLNMYIVAVVIIV